MKDKTRVHDYRMVEKGLKARDPNERKQAQNAEYRLKHEDSWTKSARERLVEETRKKNLANAWDIRDEMVKHEGRKTHTQSVSFGFHIPEGIFSHD